MTTFARGLRRFVVSQEYQQDREVRRLLRSSLSEAAALVPKIKPYASVGYDLTLTSVSLQSIGALSLNNPADLESTGPLIDHADDVVDLETLRALARATEIDMVELTANVNAAVDEIGTCTIGDILLRTPATQGVASVVGLLVLADRHASALDGDELVSWPRRSDKTGPREESNDQMTLGKTDSAPENSVTVAAPASRFARVPHAVFTRRIV